MGYVWSVERGAWSDCADNTQSRSRMCDKPSPQYDGKVCVIDPLAAEKSWIADNLVLIIIVVVVCVAIAAGVSSGDDSNVTGAGELEEAYGGFESYATMGNGGVGPDST